MQGLLFATMLGVGLGALPLCAASPPSPLKAIASKPTTNAAAAPKQDSLAETKKKAEAGDVKAQVVFANEFMRMEKYLLAERWYSEAARTGEPTALYGLAELYTATRGAGTNAVKANPTNSLTLHKLAAAQSYSPSHMRLGLMYKDGIGTRKNAVRAYTHFKLADASASRDVYMNQLIAEMTQEQIDAGDKAAAAFKPANFQAAFAEVVFESVRITGIFGGGEGRVAMINGKQLNEGQQVSLNVGGINAQVKLAEIASDGVFVSFGSMERKIKPQRM
jgi:hypothetical protein